MLWNTKAYLYSLKKNKKNKTHYCRYPRILDVKNTDVLQIFSDTLLFIHPIVVNIQSQECFKEISSDLLQKYFLTNSLIGII